MLPLLLGSVLAACGDDDKDDDADAGVVATVCEDDDCVASAEQAETNSDERATSEQSSDTAASDAAAASDTAEQSASSTASDGVDPPAGSAGAPNLPGDEVEPDELGSASDSTNDQPASTEGSDASGAFESDAAVPSATNESDASAASGALPDGGETAVTAPDAGSGGNLPNTDVEELPNLDPAPPFEGKPIKVDLLFVIDNSISMADKQELLGLALPDLVERLVSPNCVNAEGDSLPANGAQCAGGFTREFSPVTDLHLAVITTSLGGYGAQLDCGGLEPEADDQAADMAHLLGSLPRGQAAVPGAADSGFLSWSSGADAAQLILNFTDLVESANEFGCGWEAPLEAWTRFLVDPKPYTRVVRQPCNSSDTANSCAGPERDSAGVPLVDELLLEQRANFLRTDSLVSIVMLTDENDCSFKPKWQTWRLAQSAFSNEIGLSYYPAFRGTAACSDPSFGPNHECCHSCGQATFPQSCPSAADAEQRLVPLGCENGRKFSIDDTGDHPNLRCFNQKQRFGVDYLFPVGRYVNALTQEFICSSADTLELGGCIEGDVARNPLFALQDEQRRPEGWIYLVGLVGVPWQDIAVDPMGDEPLRYLSNDPAAPEAERINWSWLLSEGEFDLPEDPLMHEQVTARIGTNPATGEDIASSQSSYEDRTSNGHEWNILDESDLQYACIYPIAPMDCPTKEEADQLRDQGQLVPNCDCTDYPGDEFANPLCQAPDGSYDATQRFAKAYPALRELEVLRGMGKNGIVASICAKETSASEPDFGYRPAVNAMLERFRDALGTP